MTTLLLGMGNPILTDDAVGVLVVRELRRDLDPEARGERVVRMRRH